MEETFGLAGLVDNTTCLSVLAIGTDDDDNVNERALSDGELGVVGGESSHDDGWISVGQTLI